MNHLFTVFRTIISAIAPIIMYFDGGDGSSGNPWQITTMAHLNDVRNNLSDYFILMNDLDAGAETDNSGGAYWNGGAGWSPIAGAFFTGDFDGNGFTIDRLFISRSGTSEVGLFARQNGAVYDLQLTNVDITGGSETGGLAGYARSTGTTERCEVKGTVVGGANTGLFIGRAGDSHVIRNSDSNGSITVDGAGNLAGGFVGNNTVTIEKCYAVCTINGTSDSKNGFTHFGTVNDCFYDSTVFTGGSGRGTGKSTTDMQLVATFTDTATSGLSNAWDFVSDPNDDVATNDYWDINTSSYPHLTAFAAGDTTAPTPGGSGTFGATSGIDAQGFTASWTKATDDTSAASALRYYVYTSLSSNIGTVANAEANGTLQNSGGTLDIGTLAIDATLHGSFTPGDTVYYNVVVEDEANNKAAYTESSETTWALGGNITLTGSAENSVEVGIWEITTLDFNVTDLGTPEEVVSSDANGDWTATSYDPTKTYFVAVLHNKQEDSGTASSGSATDLTDSSKSWTTDEYAGKMVEITGATGSGQMRKIASNTATALTPDVDFDTAPDGTSTYAIYTMYGAKTKILPVTG